MLRASLGLNCKESACKCRRCWRLRSDPPVGKIPWRKEWQSTPVFLPGESPGQRSLVGYKESWDLKESEKIEHTLHAEVINSIFKPNESSICETVQRKKTRS